MPSDIIHLAVQTAWPAISWEGAGTFFISFFDFVLPLPHSLLHTKLCLTRRLQHIYAEIDDDGGASCHLIKRI